MASCSCRACALQWASRNKPEKNASYPRLEIIAKLATVLEVELAELLRMPLDKARSRGDPQ